MPNYEGIAAAVLKGSEPEVRQLTEAAINEGGDLEEIIYRGLVKGMDVVAAKWKSGELFVPEVLIASRAMKAGMGLVSPRLQKEMAHKGIFVIGTVKGDIHDIGKNLVILMMEAAGFKVIDLGTNVDKEIFVKSATDNKADLVGISALLTTTMPYMEEVVSAFQEAGTRDKVKIMVGGAPISQKFADSIGVDGYGKNATMAVDVAKTLIGL